MQHRVFASLWPILISETARPVCLHFGRSGICCCGARRDEAVAGLNINGNVLTKVAPFAMALALGFVDAVALLTIS